MLQSSVITTLVSNGKKIFSPMNDIITKLNCTIIKIRN